MTNSLLSYVSLDTWARYLGTPPVAGLIRQSPADFQVEELLAFDPDGEGEHSWLFIEKTGHTTVAVQQALARYYGVALREVAYSGLKDKYAVTRQWFSIRTGMKTGADLPVDLPGGIHCLKAVKNSRKLRRGVHKSNRFCLTVRNVAGNREELLRRLEIVGRRGVPNYFGPQRFGRDGANVIKLLEAWRTGKPARNRDQFSILLSAGRSYLFNRVLAKRVELGSWDQLVEGDCLALAGSASTFQADKAAPEELHKRLQDRDIHPTGPLWGGGESKASGAARALESSQASECAELTAGLEKQGLVQERRPLRVLVEQFEHAFDDNALVLQFVLNSGSYATAVLRELINYSERTSSDT